MTRPPAFHIWKFLMKNMTSPNSGLSKIVNVNQNHYKLKNHGQLNSQYCNRQLLPQKPLRLGPLRLVTRTVVKHIEFYLFFNTV